MHAESYASIYIRPSQMSWKRKQALPKLQMSPFIYHHYDAILILGSSQSDDQL